MKNLILLFFIIFYQFSFAQIGGKTTFALLDLGYSARSNALGENFITVKDQDVNLGVSNPSLYNRKMDKMGGLSQTLLAGGINYGMVAYAKQKDTITTIAGHLRYINYGKMERTDVSGASLGNFTPSEYIVGVGLGRKLNQQIAVGANFNLIYSQLESFNAFGISLDLAGTYTLEKSNLLVTALVKNAGVQLNTYINKNRAPLPADFQMGISHKLKHAPFRFSLVAHHLNIWDLTYTNPNLKPTINALTGDTIPIKKINFVEHLGNHLIFQNEILVSKSIHIRAAFDIYKRQNLKLEQKPGLSGFSFGLGLYFKRFNLDYGLSIYSKAGFSNSITITTNFDNWKK